MDAPNTIDTTSQLSAGESSDAMEWHSDKEELCSNYFSCSVCYNILTEPTTMPCGHTFCRYCLSHWFDTTHGRRLGYFRCPCCTQETEIIPNSNCLLRNFLKDEFSSWYTKRESELQSNPELVRKLQKLNNRTGNFAMIPQNLPPFRQARGAIRVQRGINRILLRNMFQRYRRYLIPLSILMLVLQIALLVYILWYGAPDLFDSHTSPIDDNSNVTEVVSFIKHLGPWATEDAEIFERQGINGRALLMFEKKDYEGAGIKPPWKLRVIMKQLHDYWRVSSVDSWDVDEVIEFLRGVGPWTEEHLQHFKEMKINGAAMLAFDIEDYESVGITSGWKLRLLKKYLEIFSGQEIRLFNSSTSEPSQTVFNTFEEFRKANFLKVWTIIGIFQNAPSIISVYLYLQKDKYMFNMLASSIARYNPEFFYTIYYESQLESPSVAGTTSQNSENMETNSSNISDNNSINNNNNSINNNNNNNNVNRSTVENTNGNNVHVVTDKDYTPGKLFWVVNFIQPEYLFSWFLFDHLSNSPLIAIYGLILCLISSIMRLMLVYTFFSRWRDARLLRRYALEFRRYIFDSFKFIGMWIAAGIVLSLVFELLGTISFYAILYFVIHKMYRNLFSPLRR